MYLQNEIKERLLYTSTFHQNLWAKDGELMMQGNALKSPAVVLYPKSQNMYITFLSLKQ
jgi:hypothetical protein